MSIRKEEVAAVEALGAFGDLQLNSYDVAIALAKRVGKNMGKLETNPSKADVGIRIDVNSKNRGTIIGFEEDRHLILLDGDEEGKYFNLKLTNCMLYGRVSPRLFFYFLFFALCIFLSHVFRRPLFFLSC